MPNKTIHELAQVLRDLETLRVYSPDKSEISLDYDSEFNRITFEICINSKYAELVFKVFYSSIPCHFIGSYSPSPDITKLIFNEIRL